MKSLLAVPALGLALVSQPDLIESETNRYFSFCRLARRVVDTKRPNQEIRPMSREFIINCFVALFSVVVMLLGIKLAAAAETATVDTPTQSPCHSVEFENSLAPHLWARAGK